MRYYEELKQIGLQKLQESMSRALGLATLITYPDGSPLIEISNLCSFCALLNNTNPEGRARCAASRVVSARAAMDAGKPVLRNCHAGLVHLVVPLRVAGETVAVLIGGNVALQPLAEEAVAQLARETGIDRKELLSAAKTVPIWPEERLLTAMEMIREVTETVARMLFTRHELQKRVDELTALFEFSKTVSGSLQVAGAARQGLQAALELTGATSGSVIMLGETELEAADAEVAATIEPCSEQRVIPAGEIIAAVGREVTAAHFDSRPGERTPEEKRPAIAIPLTVGGKVTGVLTLAGRPEGRRFTEEETVFLTTLGTALGLALENARLFRKVQERAAMLEWLIEVGKGIASSLDADLIVERTLASLREHFGTPWCTLRVHEEKNGEVVLKAGEGLKKGICNEVRVSSAASTTCPLINQVIRAKEPMAIEDINTAGIDLPCRPQEIEVRSMAMVPVLAMGKLLGTLAFHSSVPRRWGEEEIGYLATIASQMGLALENARLYASLREYYLSTVQALAAALEAKDLYTKGHSIRVARWARSCARLLGLGDEEQEQVYMAGLLHDIGKIGVREDILLKPGPLTREEREEVKNHPEVGARILEPARFPEAVIAAVRHHHEDYGGGGYPAGLSGEKIPLLARILRVADTYDAMTSARPYRKAFTRDWACRELERFAGSQFDPRVVEAFLRIPHDELVYNVSGGGGGYSSSSPWRNILFA